MNKKIILIITIIIATIVLLCNLADITISKGISQYEGQANFLIAKPICRLITDTNLYISNYEKKELYFSICNYDENEKISEVEMQYYIKISLTQKNAPLKYKIYRIHYNGSETQVNLDIGTNLVRTLNAVSFSTQQKELHKYKLEIEYDKSSSIAIDKNIKINIGVESEQIQIT